MSFTSDTKKELTSLIPERKCCQLAEITGFLRCAGSITFDSRMRMGVKVVTDNPAVARLFVTLAKEYFGTKSQLVIGDNPSPSRNRLYELSLTPDMNAEAVLRETGMLGIREGSNYLTDGFDPAIIRKRCCKKAALRGVFLASGALSDPVKGYHLEISCLSDILARDVQKLVNSFGLKAKIVIRRDRHVVYLKDAEQIQDFLNAIGATGQMLTLQNVRMTKELVNNANRASNCENANIERTVTAAQKQLDAIAVIQRTRGIESLPDTLYEAARMRLANPELSLADLCELTDPPISKSGMNHRFEKIAALAKQLSATHDIH